MYSGDRAPGSKDTTTEGLDRPRRLQRGGGLVNRLDSNRQRWWKGKARPGLPGWDGSHMGAVKAGRPQERSEAGREGAWPQGPPGWSHWGTASQAWRFRGDSSPGTPGELRLLWEKQVETELESWVPEGTSSVERPSRRPR